VNGVPEPLAIVAAGGTFPLAVADRVAAGGRPVFVIALDGVTDADVSRFRHAWVGLGQVSRLLRLLARERCREVVFVGALTRPAGWRSVVPDFGLIRRLPRIVHLFRGGDDHLLSGVVRLAEEAGLVVRGVHEVAPTVLLPAGGLGRVRPTAAQQEEIAFAAAFLQAIGRFDVGQAVVVADRRVIAVEAAEGTDRMLARVADLRRSGGLKLPQGQGVLVKIPKPGQDLRVDMPALGPNTVAGVLAAGLAGIAGEAGRVLAVDAEALLAAADAAGLFLYGFDAPADDGRA
jgi:DUF1009 family protein